MTAIETESSTRRTKPRKWLIILAFLAFMGVQLLVGG